MAMSVLYLSSQNQLKQAGSNVIHGIIREVSLVLPGANPGAFIDDVLAHGDGESAGIIVGYDEMIMGYLEHSDDEKKQENGDDGEETVEEVFKSLTEKQKNCCLCNYRTGLRRWRGRL